MADGTEHNIIALPGMGYTGRDGSGANVQETYNNLQQQNGQPSYSSQFNDFFSNNSGGGNGFDISSIMKGVNFGNLFSGGGNNGGNSASDYTGQAFKDFLDNGGGKLGETPPATDESFFNMDNFGKLADIGQSLGNLYMGNKALGLQEDIFSHSKGLDLANFENNRELAQKRLNDQSISNNIERPGVYGPAPELSSYGQPQQQSA